MNILFKALQHGFGASPLCLALLVAPPAALAQCAPAAPVTGLGACIDGLAAHSVRVTGQIDRLG